MQTDGRHTVTLRLPLDVIKHGFTSSSSC